MRNAFVRRHLRINSSRRRLLAENSDFAAAIPPGSLVLDAGAGDAPYKCLLKHVRYESVDFEQVDKPYAKSTYVCDVTQIPVEDKRFDYIIFNQVMEHVPEPKRALQELYRVLKPGGKMIYSAPLFYEEHEEPYDFYRYTKYGVKYLLAESGFTIDRLDWLEGYYSTLAYQLERAAQCLPSRPSRIAVGRPLVGLVLAPVMVTLRAEFRLLSVMLHNLELRYKYTEKGYPKNYVAIASRALDGEGIPAALAVGHAEMPIVPGEERV